jgi:hypothetical protein
VSAEEPTTDERVSALRGAGVAQFDRRRLVAVALVLLVVGLAVVSAGFYVGGAHKNAQVADLKDHGVPVELTVTGCLGLLGGSGSNVAGYACRGAYTLDGHRHVEQIPGNTLYPPGTRVRGVAVPGDPGLVSTARIVAGEQVSNGVYILPSVLAALDVVAVAGALVLRRRTARTAASPPA